MSGALARAAFYPTLLYNVVMEKVTSRRWYDRIDSRVLLGALPFKRMSERLVEEEDVKRVVTMNENYETRYLCKSAKGWQKLGVEQLRLSTTDLTPPSVQDLTKGVNFILDALEGSVYVHCKAGRSRSAILVACYLMKVHNWSPEEAVSFIKDKRPHVMILPSHYEVLRTFQQTLSD